MAHFPGYDLPRFTPVYFGATCEIFNVYVGFSNLAGNSVSRGWDLNPRSADYETDSQKTDSLATALI